MSDRYEYSLLAWFINEYGGEGDYTNLSVLFSDKLGKDKAEDLSRFIVEIIGEKYFPMYEAEMQ